MISAGGITTLVLSEGDTVRIGVFGELDLFTADELAAVTADSLKRRPARLVMDVSAVTFCDACGLTALADAKDIATRAGAQFTLTGARDVLLRLVDITGLHALFGPHAHHQAASRGPTSA